MHVALVRRAIWRVSSIARQNHLSNAGVISLANGLRSNNSVRTLNLMTQKHGSIVERRGSRYVFMALLSICVAFTHLSKHLILAELFRHPCFPQFSSSTLSDDEV